MLTFVCAKRLLAKGLNFSLPPTQLHYSGYLVNHKLFLRIARKLSILSNEDLGFVKTQIKETAHSSYRNYNM